MEPKHYDLVVIGSGPAGQKGAIAAAKLRKKVAVIDRHGMVGGVCVHTGTIPSKTLREAILYLSGFQQRTFYGRDYCLKDQIAVQDLDVPRPHGRGLRGPGHPVAAQAERRRDDRRLRALRRPALARSRDRRRQGLSFPATTS